MTRPTTTVGSRYSDKRMRLKPWCGQWRAVCEAPRCHVEIIDQSRNLCRDVALEHLRYDHPTENERMDQEIHRAMFDLPGCERCGHEDHESAACPTVRPDVLRSDRR